MLEAIIMVMDLHQKQSQIYGFLRIFADLFTDFCGFVRICFNTDLCGLLRICLRIFVDFYGFVYGLLRMFTDFLRMFTDFCGFLRKIEFYVSKKRILTICTPSDPNSRRRQDPILRFPPFPLKTPFRKICIANFCKKVAKIWGLLFAKIRYSLECSKRRFSRCKICSFTNLFHFCLHFNFHFDFYWQVFFIS